MMSIRVTVGISSAVVFIFIVGVIVYLIMKYSKKKSKHLPIVLPGRPKAKTLPESAQQDENDNTTIVTGVIPNDVTNADDQTSLLSEESVCGSGMGGTPEQMPSYSKVAVNDATAGAPGGSECDTEECRSPGVDVNNSEQTEPVDEDKSSGSIQPYTKVGRDGPAGGGSGGESDCTDDEDCPEVVTDEMDSSAQCSGMSSGSDYCNAAKAVLAIPEPDGPAAAINIDRPEGHLPSPVTSQPALATSSDRTDSSGQSSSAMSSGFGYCPANVNDVALTEPVGKAADIDTGRPRLMVSHPDLVSTLPEGCNTSQENIAESVV